ncbi:hypothetical protein CL673_05175 [Candidatus Bathyarchaeota archaeon]|nr:hypothetical protein [Candidatus Bathyarchaeota archaeon]
MGINISRATTVRWLIIEAMNIPPRPKWPRVSGFTVQRQSKTPERIATMATAVRLIIAFGFIFSPRKDVFYLVISEARFQVIGGVGGYRIPLLAILRS